MVWILRCIADLVEDLRLRTPLLPAVAWVDVVRFLAILGKLGHDRVELLRHEHARVPQELELGADTRDGPVDLRGVRHDGR
jgi:hypothetical protein